MTSCRIQFLPDGREACVDETTTLLDAARAADVYVGAVCGGDGTCGKCRLVVRSGDVDASATELLTPDERARGYVLACRTLPRGDVVVEVPPESRLGGYRDAESASARYRDFTRGAQDCAAGELDPVVAKVAVRLAEPTVDDARGDHERVLHAVGGALAPDGGRGLTMGIATARELPRTLRSFEARGSSWTWRWDGAITATVARRTAAGEIVRVERGDTSSRSYGLAVDVGTTTVVVHLVDLASGKTLDAAATYNSQMKLGADVIARINAARRGGGANALHAAVVSDINMLSGELASRCGVKPDEIRCVVAAGNTTMIHLLLGLEADLIRLAPFVPAATTCPRVAAADVGIAIHPAAAVYALPHIGSYVGGDITAGILASGIRDADEVSLLLDIGTNGEVVLGNREFLVACAASAGPAFEGGQVSCGMRATAGAIDTVSFAAPDVARYTTIDGEAAVGICGTGLVDVLAGMFVSGLVDRSGNLQSARAPGIFRARADGREEFVLARASEGGRDVTIDRADVENLIRTKGAIYAAADSLVQSVGLAFDDVMRVYIAGAFGNKLNVANCITIGLLPDVPLDRIRFIGNSSVAGARLAMLSRRAMDRAHEIAADVTYQELMVDPAYMERFTSACFLPHTDIARFPSVQAALGSGR